MPKLTKKHRTFDCDLNFLEPQPQPQPQPQLQPQPQPQQPNQQPPTIPQRVNQPNATGRPIAQPNDYSSTYYNQPIRTNNQPDPNVAHADDQFDESLMQKQRNKHTTAVPITNNQNNNNNNYNFNHNQSENNNQNPQRLSKLVLSSSMQQLADSKFHTNHHQMNAQPANMGNNNTQQNEHENIKNIDHVNYQPKPSTTTTTTNIIETNAHINENNNHHEPKIITTTNTNSPPKQISNHANNNNDNKPRQREANLDTVHVVVGNEACDLDSAVSCLLMFHIISKMSDEINGKDKTRTLYIPLLNTTRDMLDSKCEVLWFLQKTLNIDKSFLTCKDDIDWVEIKKNGVEVLITLVDHNYNDEFKDIGKIVEIIDHHQVQNPQWLMENQSGIRLTLDNSVGSCTTLVAERLFYIYAEHHVSDEILLLIYGTVLLDTICLSEKAKRFTRRDVYLLKKLDALLGSKRPVRDELYRQLVEVKNNTKDMNFEHLMKRDLKIYKDKRGMRIGIASLFGMAAKEALGLAANIDLDQFFRQNQYEAFIIMGLIADLDHSDSISRDLVLISANGRLFDELCRAFEQDTSKLDLVPIGSDSSPDPEDNIINNKKIVDSSSTSGASNAPNSSDANPNPFYKARIWLQRNVTSSRKVVAPLVLKVLHDGVQS